MKILHLLMIMVLSIFVLINTNHALAICCFPYDYEGYYDPLSGFFVANSELQNDSYFNEPFGNATYTFKFNDKNNNLILVKNQTITNTLPIRSGFVIPPGISLPFKIAIEDRELGKKIKNFNVETRNLDDFPWKPADLIVSSNKIKLVENKGGYNTWVISGTILNNYTKDAKNVYVLAGIHGKFDHIIGVAGYSNYDMQPLELKGFETKKFALYVAIPQNLHPESVSLYAESDYSSMMYPNYFPLITKVPFHIEPNMTSSKLGSILITSDIRNISRVNQDFVWILQIKKSPVDQNFQRNDPQSKVAHIAFIHSSVKAQNSTKIQYTWHPDSQGTYFYEIYVWKSLEYPKPLSAAYRGSFTNDNTLFVR